MEMLVLEQGLESKEGLWGESGRAEGRWGGWEAHGSYQEMVREGSTGRKGQKDGNSSWGQSIEALVLVQAAYGQEKAFDSLLPGI